MRPWLLMALLVTATSAATTQTDPAHAPFYDTVGLVCNKRTDCGYVPALACLQGKCEYCRPTAHDCNDHRDDVDYVCQVIEVLDEVTGKTEAQQGLTSTGDTVSAAYCVEKNLFSPFTYKDLITTLVAFSSTALGAGGGVGGGGLLVPMYILGGLNPKHAIPLSKVTIFGSAVAMYTVNFRRKHPLNKNRPLIDFGLVGLMEPTTLIGTVFGVMLNHIFPNWLILVCLVTLLTFITYKTILKGNTIQDKEDKYRLTLVISTLKGGPNGGGRGRKWSIYRRFDVEVAARRWLNKTRRRRKVRQIREEDEADFQSLPPLNDRKPTSSDPLIRNKRQFGTFSSDEDTQTQRRNVIERREVRVFPLEYLWPLALSWLLILVQSMLRGGHGAPSAIGVKCNSSSYWLLTLLPLAVPISVSLRMGYRLRLLNRVKVLGNYPFVDGDIHWIKRRVLMFPAVCTTAGVAAGLLGIGGGMVKGPIMLEAGVLPAVQSATASFMILFTASSTTLQFAINGQFPGEFQFDYMVWFAFVGFVGGFCGLKCVGYFVKKYKRESIMVYMLAATIGLSAVAMGAIGVRSTLVDIENGVHLGFLGICDSE
ncbi:Sulfite exporter TauE/SafE [Phytophthora infestans]|uniref:Sulfite exporter TauE/SafE n=1 Tax=Phytophthora infestans TaxID=4787 RepID=A0A833SAF1_PHYIN|nr:Sulfite exporter TauE/SafE [Phytophthora infestans]